MQTYFMPDVHACCGGCLQSQIGTQGYNTAAECAGLHAQANTARLCAVPWKRLTTRASTMLMRDML